MSSTSATVELAAPSHLRRTRSGFLHDLEGQPALGFVGPNWFASVMGTGIVANAAATLPVRVPGLLGFAQVVWGLAVVLLVLVTTAFVAHWVRHREVARTQLADPTLSYFYGAPAMALLTVGAGALLVGAPLVGEPTAVTADAALWVTGTALGLATSVAVPYRAFTSHHVAADAAFGGWLMPVVPPMVSAATGALLLPHVPAGQWRETLLLGCLMMFGLALVASLIVITLVWSRLVHHRVGASAAVPTLWIVLGPLGQSITAAHHLGVAAPAILPAPYGRGFQALALVYGVPMWGFAMLWLALAAAITARTARTGLPFSLSWWSFTFPVGTVVTGTSGLADLTGLHLLTWAAVLGYAGLLGAWALVATRTAHGAYRGRLLRRPA